MCNYVCSDGGSTYIICEMIGKTILNAANLMQTFEIFFSKITEQNS